MSKTFYLFLTALFAAGLLSGCGRKAAGNAASTLQLIEELEATEPERRVNAAIQLGRARDPAAVEALVACLTDIRADVKKAVIEALGAIGDRRAAQPLGSVMIQEGVDPELQRMAADAIGLIGDPSAVPALAQALASDNEGLAYAAAYSLGKTGGDAALEALAAAVRGNREFARRAAAAALGEIPGDRTVAILRNLLGHPDPSIRLSAAENLVKLGDKSELGKIAALLLDPDLTVRKAMPRIIRRFGAEIVPHLTLVLKERSYSVKRDDGTGKMVDVPTQGARQVALQTVCRFSGKQVIEPLLLSMPEARGSRNEAAYNHLVKQMELQDCRKELLTVAARGSVADQELVMSILSDFFRSRLGGKITAPDRKDFLARNGLEDLRDFIEFSAGLTTSSDAALSFNASLLLCTFGDQRGKGPVLAQFRKDIPKILAQGPAGEAQELASIKAWKEQLKKEGVDYDKLDRNGRKKHRRHGGWGGVSGPEVESAKRCLDALAGVADKQLADELLPLLSTGFKWGGNWEHILGRVADTMARVGDASYKEPLLNLMEQAAAVEPRGPTSLGSALARALGTLGEKRAFDHIVKFVNKMYHDQYHIWARSSCYAGLLGCDRERAYKAIGDILTSAEPKNASGIENIVRFFQQNPDAGAVMPLMFWINHDIRVEQEKVRNALVAIGKVNMDWLVAGFRVEDHRNRSSLAGVIADGFGADAVPTMLKAAKSDDDRIRQGAVWALGCIGGADAVNAVRDALKDEHAGVRSAAAWSAGRLAHSSLRQPMLDLLRDHEATVRVMAAEKLGDMKGEGIIIPGLIAALNDKDPRVRGYAATSLAKLTAVDALPALELLEKDTNSDVRAAAEYALKTLKRGRKDG